MSDLADTNDKALLITAQTLVMLQARLGELDKECRLLVVVEEERRLNYEAEKRGVDQRIKEAQGVYDLELRILCNNACPDPGTKAFQVGDQAVVVSRPLSETVGTLKIIPLVATIPPCPPTPQPREGGQS